MMFFLIFYIFVNSIYCEEIKLKDGTVIFGDFEGEMDDYFVIRTKYGVLSVPKSDIIKDTSSIVMPDNTSLKIKITRSSDVYTREFFQGENIIGIQKISIDGVVIMSSGTIKDGIYFEYDEDNNVISERMIRNGLENGPLIEFYPDGKIKARIDYKDGKMHGKAIFYSPDAKPILEQTYSNNLLDGFSIEYDADGNVKSKILYSSGKIADSMIKEEKVQSEISTSSHTEKMSIEKQLEETKLTTRVIKIARGKKVFVNINFKYSGSFTYDMDYNIIDITGRIPDGDIMVDDDGKKLQFVFSSNWPNLLTVYEKNKVKSFVYDDSGRAKEQK